MSGRDDSISVGSTVYVKSADIGAVGDVGTNVYSGKEGMVSDIDTEAGTVTVEIDGIPWPIKLGIHRVLRLP